MELTVVNDLGQPFSIDVNPNMYLEQIRALVEAETGTPIPAQVIYFEGRELTDPRKAILHYGIVGQDAIVLLRRKEASIEGSQIERDAEILRLQTLNYPDRMREKQESRPELAATAQSGPAHLEELPREDRERQHNVEAEAQKVVLENLEHAMDFSPESFGRVIMLYIPVEVNSHPLKAFIETGAQQTIMSVRCAEACGSCLREYSSIMPLIDKRFARTARGVGTAKILGRVHSTQVKLADFFFPCSFTIMEGGNGSPDILLGLDILKSYQACIDLEKNVLRIQGREVKFLAEHEL